MVINTANGINKFLLITASYRTMTSSSELIIKNPKSTMIHQAGAKNPQLLYRLEILRQEFVWTRHMNFEQTTSSSENLNICQWNFQNS